MTPRILEGSRGRGVTGVRKVRSSVSCFYLKEQMEMQTTMDDFLPASAPVTDQ